MGLTDRQEKFIQELVKGESQRKAYRIAYPQSQAWKDSAVDSRASNLLKNRKVMERYEELRSKLKEDAENECIASARDILKELAAIAFLDVTDVVNIENNKVVIKPTATLPDAVKKAISGIKQTRTGIEIKFHDKEKALEMLGRHLGLFKDNVELNTGNLGDAIAAAYAARQKDVPDNES